MAHRGSEGGGPDLLAEDHHHAAAVGRGLQQRHWPGDALTERRRTARRRDTPAIWGPRVGGGADKNAVGLPRRGPSGAAPRAGGTLQLLVRTGWGSARWASARKTAKV